MFIRHSVRSVVGIALLVAMVGGIGGLSDVGASPSLQAGTLTITDFEPSSGVLDASTPEVTYQFICSSGGVASVHAETTSGDLEVAILVHTLAGSTLAKGGVVSTNPNVSVAEAFEMQSNERCMVTLSRVGNTTGQYAVRLLPGYAQLDKYDTFDAPDAPLQMAWDPYASTSMTVATVAQQLQIQVFTDNLLGYALPSVDDFAWDDFYIQADFEVVGDPSYAEYGFVLRVDNEVDLFYTLTFSSDGDWSVYAFDGEWNPIQEWTLSPRVDGLDRNPTVGVWVDGYTFRAYFNGMFVGEVTDTSATFAEGNLGVVAATGVDQTDPLTVFIDNLIITTPATVPAAGLPLGGDTTGATPTPSGLAGMLGATKPPSQNQPTPTFAPLIPTATSEPVQTAIQLSTWNSGSPKQIVAELIGLGLVPSGGAVALNVPSSYGDTSSPGFSFYPLGQGRSFRNFVLAFDARLLNTGAESGCGMFFRDASNSSSDALVFEDGSFLLGEWDAAGNLLDSSYFDSHSAVIPGLGATNMIIVVAYESDVSLFVNGTLLAQSVFTPAQGGLALEMYVAEDEFGTTQQTYCQLNDIWLWEF